MLTETAALKNVQEPFEIVYYLWYNQFSQKDFKVRLNVKNGGPADIYVNTFDERDETQGLVNRLPNSKRNAKWVLENLSPTTTIDLRELLVVNQERAYCDYCYYIVGVVTHEQKTEYTLGLEVLDANFKNAQLMKIGETYESTIAMDQT